MTKLTAQPLRWRTASKSRRPVVHKGDVTLTFVADGLQADGETPRENAPGPISTLGMKHPELAGTRPEALLAELQATLEWQLWTEAKRTIDDINEDIGVVETSMSQLAQGEQSYQTHRDQNELKHELDYLQNRLAEAVLLAQPLYDSVCAKAKGFLDSAANAAHVTLLAQRQAILAELSEVAGPILDRLVINADALLRRDHGNIPNIGPRPEIPKHSPLEAHATV